MFKSIKAKFVTTYVFITFLFVGMLIAVLYIKERNNVINIRLEKSLSINTLNAKLVSAEFQRYSTVLKVVTRNPEIKQGNVDYILDELQRLMTLESYPFHNAIYVDNNLKSIDARGNVGTVAGRSFADKRWLTSDYTITAPIISRLTGEPVIAVGAPIFNDSSQFIGVIAITFPLTYISERLASIQIGKDSYAWLTTTDGQVIYHPQVALSEQANIYQSDSPEFVAISDKSKLAKAGHAHFFNQESNQENTVFFSKIDSTFGWTMYITAPNTSIFGDIENILVDILVNSLISMLLLLFIVVKLTNNITKPLIQLTHIVKSSQSNHFQPIKPLKSEDEIGQLSKAFSEMVNKVNHYTHNLETLVEQRTAELNDTNGKLEKANLQLSLKNQELTNIALIDPLSQLYNRRAFNNFAHIEMEKINHNSHSISLAVIDIDHFKVINDSFGHDIGDSVLVTLAKLLKQNCRESDVICRWGGEEFIILMVDVPPDEALNAINRLKDTVSKHPFEPVKQLTFSGGVTTYSKGETLKEWVARADQALYRAKQSGRNQILEA